MSCAKESRHWLGKRVHPIWGATNADVTRRNEALEGLGGPFHMKKNTQMTMFGRHDICHGKFQLVWK